MDFFLPEKMSNHGLKSFLLAYLNRIPFSIHRVLAAVSGDAPMQVDLLQQILPIQTAALNVRLLVLPVSESVNAS